MPAATEAGEILRHRGAGGDHPARPHCGEDGASVFEAAAGTGGAGMFASFAGAGAGANFGRTAVSGAVAAHGHDWGGIYRRGSGGVATRVWFQPLGEAHERSGSEAEARDGEEGDYG